jgi:hypothetical protein
VIEVEVVSTKIKGPYPAAVLERIAANQTEPIRWCVGEEVDAGANLDWKVTVSFEVAPRNAKLEDVKVESRELSDEAETCVARRFGIARFPVIEIKGPTRVVAEYLVRYSLTGTDGGTTK